MYELVESHERRVDRSAGTTPRARKPAGMADKRSRTAVCAALALALALVALAAFSIYDVGRAARPSDEALAANFASHEARFDELVEMLAADRQPLAAKGEASIDLGTIGRVTAGGARFGVYKDLLQQISVDDFHYFPDSGKIVLVPDGEENPERPSTSYRYLPHVRPQSLTRYHGYIWRGPGSYILAGDRSLKGSWFIHDDRALEVAISPY